jgi:hypothetical protein
LPADGTHLLKKALAALLIGGFSAQSALFFQRHQILLEASTLNGERRCN